MIRIPLFASACLALAACGMGVSSDNNAASVCNTMLAGDPESLGLEDAAGRLMSDFIEDGSSPAYGITRSDFEMTGTYIDQVRRELNKDDSACTAS